MYPKEIPELDIKDKGAQAGKYLAIFNACGNMDTLYCLLDAGIDRYSHQERIWRSQFKDVKISTHFNNPSN